MNAYLKMFTGLVVVLALFVAYMTLPYYDAGATGIEPLFSIERQIVNLTIHANCADYYCLNYWNNLWL